MCIFHYCNYYLPDFLMAICLGSSLVSHFWIFVSISLNLHKPFVESSFLTRDQALSLWSGNTDSKTLSYQRTNHREYQIVRTHTKETTWIQDPTSPNHQYHPVQDASSKQQTKQNHKPRHQQTGLPQHSALPIRGKPNNKQTNKNSAQISPYIKLTQTTGPTLGGQKAQERKNSTSKPGKRRLQTQ